MKYLLNKIGVICNDTLCPPYIYNTTYYILLHIDSMNNTGMYKDIREMSMEYWEKK